MGTVRWKKLILGSNLYLGHKCLLNKIIRSPSPLTILHAPVMDVATISYITICMSRPGACDRCVT